MGGKFSRKRRESEEKTIQTKTPANAKVWQAVPENRGQRRQSPFHPDATVPQQAVPGTRLP